MNVVIIGAGAAGCFCSIELKRSLAGARVMVLEALDRPLAKVSITGGGRCNLTNSFEGISDLREVYPRGHRVLARAFKKFDHEDCRRWFEQRGVPLVTQTDHCVFPSSQDAMQIVRTLEREMRSLGVELRTGAAVESVQAHDDGFAVTLKGGETLDCTHLVVTSGGRSRGGRDFLAPLGLKTVDSVPSLFSFVVADEALTELTGTVVQDAAVTLQGTRLCGEGPLLITHRGLSGPAVLRLSSYAARELAQRQYRSTISVRWLADKGEEQIRSLLEGYRRDFAERLCLSVHPQQLPSRLWQHLLRRAGLRDGLRWAEIGSRGLGRLVNTLMNDSYPMTGKNHWKEEFVTCGGVDLSEINPSTMESRRYAGLYFAGEVLDIDGLTGGFNLQAAWSTGYVAARDIFSKLADDNQKTP